MKEDSCLSFAFHYPLKPKQGSSVESQELLKEVFYEIQIRRHRLLQVGIDR